MPAKKEINIAELKKLAAEGCSQTEMAAAFGFERAAFGVRLKKEPALVEAIMEGQAQNPNIHYRKRLRKRGKTTEPALQTEIKAAPEVVDVPEIPEKDIRAKIFEAVDAGYCTLAMICRQINLVYPGQNFSSEDLRETLEEMELEREIVELVSGEITGYFRASKVPRRFWLDGKGKCAMEFPDRQAERASFDELVKAEAEKAKKFSLGGSRPQPLQTGGNGSHSPKTLAAAGEVIEKALIKIDPVTLMPLVEDIERVENVRLVEVPTVQVKEINLHSGKLHLALDVNLFETPPEEREFLNDLIDTIQSFETGR